MLAFALTLLTAISAFAAPNVRRREICGSKPSPKEIEEAETDFAKFENVTDSNSLGTRHSSSDTTPIQIPVYWHVIRANTTYSGGSLTASEIEKQIVVLNEAYKKGGISFTLIDTDYTTDAEWFDQLGPSNSAVEKEVKERLRQGDQSTLNLYSTGFTQEDELLGQATFPKDYTKNPELDGVMFAYSTLPDGSNVPYNLGHTLIHEVGHWVGLYHTFQGGCKGHGDHVSDTPAEADATYGCPAAPDSCPDQPGLDPIHNYMDYTDDACNNQFTDGQFKRVRKQLKHYRSLPV